MTGALWMPGVHHRSLVGRSNGSHNAVAGWHPTGVVLHVNDSPVGSRGTSIDWYAAGGGSDSVCPTWQVYPDGETWQLLPANVQPWCQAAGNSWGLAIETGGNHAEPLTGKAVAAAAAIMRWVHDEWGIPLQVTDHPSRPGLGTHKMGGQAWGGHPCPGTIRAAQRQQILDIAQGGGMAQLDDDDRKFIRDVNQNNAQAVIDVLRQVVQNNAQAVIKALPAGKDTFTRADVEAAFAKALDGATIHTKEN